MLGTLTYPAKPAKQEQVLSKRRNKEPALAKKNPLIGVTISLFLQNTLKLLMISI